MKVIEKVGQKLFKSITDTAGDLGGRFEYEFQKLSSNVTAEVTEVLDEVISVISLIKLLVIAIIILVVLVIVRYVFFGIRYGLAASGRGLLNPRMMVMLSKDASEPLLSAKSDSDYEDETVKKDVPPVNWRQRPIPAPRLGVIGEKKETTEVTMEEPGNGKESAVDTIRQAVMRGATIRALENMQRDSVLLMTGMGHAKPAIL